MATLTGLRAPESLAAAVVTEIVRPAAPFAAVAPLAGPAADGSTPGGPGPGGAAPDGCVLAVLAVAPDRAGDAVDQLRAAAAALAPGLGAGRLVLGVSAAAAGVGALAGAVEEAWHAHRSALGGAGPVAVVAAGELTSYALLLAGVPADTRRAFRGRLLGPLVDYDRSHGADLLHTLAEFLDCGGSWSRCAQRLHLHVNTLRYRIGRIEQLTGRDLDRFEDRVDLFLALRLPER